MIKRLIFLSLFLFSFFFSAQNKTGNISGNITSIEDEPLELVSISLIELNKSTLTDIKGNFNFSQVAPGNYTIKIQMLGLKEQQIPIEVKEDENTPVNYKLAKENILALQEVRIVGNNSKITRKESPYVAKLPIKYLENPQVYNTVPKELITQQMAVDLGSVSKNVPGAGIPMIANQGRVTFRSRGFETEPNARNGVAGAAFSFLDNANLERIEAIKGPSTTLFGTQVSSSYGGLYNRVTKKPYNGTGGEVSYTGGSWNFNRLTFDANTPINGDKTALLRLNGATTFEKSFQDNGFTNSLALAPSFSYQINDRLSLLFDVEFGIAKGTSVVRFNPYTKSNKIQSIEDINFPYKRTFLGDDITYSTQMMNIFGQLNYKISSSWTSQTIFSRARSTINGYITALNGKSDTTIQPSVIVGNTNFIATNLQQNFIGDFYIGKFRNRMVVGLDYYNNFNNFDRVTVNAPAVDFINTPSTYRVTRDMLDTLTNTGTPRKEKSSDDTYAAYVSDVFDITDRLKIMASLRVDNFHYNGVYNILTGETAGGLSVSGLQAGPYTQTALSHKSGLIYELLKNKLSLFGNYLNGFFNISGVDKNGNNFIPQKGNQLEFGAKSDLFSHRLVGTISYYDIKVDHVLRADPDDANFSIQDGSQYSKGVEIDITANPMAGLNIIVGYAYNDSKFTKSDASVLNLRPAASGPQNMYNFWVSYSLTKGKFSGLGAGFGGNIGSMSYQTNTQTAKVIIPSYKMFDASIFYDRPKYRLGLKIDNITSEKAWSVRLTPQAPIRFLGSISLKF
ncbi:MAG: TonB-dependent receptor [Candidatus Chryseobacterium colombiense]|nr:TonB-dependent receptor [Chryseobacterium sp.]WEK71334.1 MAG: TonB-dependent receptor [Chryseobacterium sp.]